MRQLFAKPEQGDGPGLCLAGTLAAGRTLRAARRHPGDHQGKHCHPGRTYAAGHSGHRAAAGTRRCTARRPLARGGCHRGLQNHHARLRHALQRFVELSQIGPQPLGLEQDTWWLQRRWRCGRRSRLRATAHRHRHWRLAAPAGRLVRHFQPQAQPGSRPD